MTLLLLLAVYVAAVAAVYRAMRPAFTAADRVDALFDRFDVDRRQP